MLSFPVESVIGRLGSNRMLPLLNEYVKTIAFEWTGVITYARGVRSCAQLALPLKQIHKRRARLRNFTTMDMSVGGRPQKEHTCWQALLSCWAGYENLRVVLVEPVVP